MKTPVETALIIYEPEQIASLEKLLKQGYEDTIPTIIALDMEVEFLLQEKNISFLSGRAYQSKTSAERTVMVGEWTKEIFLNPRWSFFAYRGVPFTEMFFSPLSI